MRTFYLGTHQPSWLTEAGVPLFRVGLATTDARSSPSSPWLSHHACLAPALGATDHEMASKKGYV